MQPFKKAPHNWNQPTSGDAGVLKESGVRTISRADREAIDKEIEARLSPQAQPENAGESYQDSVRPSTQDVCPKMLEAHVSLVHQVVAPIARRMPANVLREDLLAAGFFGLVDSLRKNGGDNGSAFEWYARMRIRGAVLDELRAQDWVSRRRRDALNAAAERDEGEHEGVVFVGLDELCPHEEFQFFTAFGADAAASYEANETLQLLVEALDELPIRDRTVVGAHYFKGKTFRDIGMMLDISETRAFQIHARALTRLRSFFDKRMRRSSSSSTGADHVEIEADAGVEAERDLWTEVFGPDKPPPNAA